MDESVERIIRRVLEETRAKGRDHITQTELAVRTVCEARPDMTASDALAAVEMVRRSWRPNPSPKNEGMMSFRRA